MMLEVVKENCASEDIEEVLNNMQNNRTFLTYALETDDVFCIDCIVHIAPRILHQHEQYLLSRNYNKNRL